MVRLLGLFFLGPGELVLRHLSLLCCYSQVISCVLETESFIDIADGIITRATVLSPGAANCVLILTATVDQAVIEELENAAACFIGGAIREVSAFTRRG